MRILQASKAYLPHIGGIETVVRQLAEGFAQHPDNHSQVLACSDNRKSRRERINGVDITYAASLGRVSSLPISPSYTSHLLAATADILLIHEPSLLASAAYRSAPVRAGKRFGKLVIWWHSDIVRQKLIQPFYKPLYRSMLTRADAIIVATPNHISSSKLLPEFADKCHVIHFGYEAEESWHSRDVKNRAKEIRSEHSRPIVLFVGRLVYYKGAEYLAQAAHLIPEADFVFVGKGPLLNNLRKIAAAGPGRVKFISYLSDSELAAYYEACELLVLPSVENSEAFGLVQLDAMAHGKPVVTCDLPTGVTYVNRDGITGLVVPKRDHQSLAVAIKRLLGDKNLRCRMGETARRRIYSDFKVDGMVNSTGKLFHKLMKK